MSALQLDFDSVTEADHERRAILLAIATSPTYSATTKAVAQAIADHITPGQGFSQNDIRPHLPSWIKANGIGPAFQLLRRRGAIRPIAKVTTTHRGTHGKTLDAYELLVTPA